jgi:hypothetical protein
MQALVKRLGCLAVLTGLLAVACAVGADDKKSDGFTPLFNGQSFEGWKSKMQGGADPMATWSIKDGVIVCTGKPNGFGYTEKSYKNYVIRYDWQYIQPPEGQKSSFNSGLLLHIQDPATPVAGGIWPRCVEAQGALKDHGRLYFVGSKKVGDAKYDQQAKDKATKPIGEWNTTEATCKADGAIVVNINGAEVASGKSDLTEGHIGFQSEGAEIHFRNIQIKELKE